MSQELTIVLLLKDRLPFTWRWLDFYNQHPLPYKILLADGSLDSSAEKLRDTTLYSNLEYEYIRYPYDKTKRDYYQKLADVVSRVTTPFILLASNHDFYLPQTISESIAFLKNHPDYSSARGEVYDITVQTNRVPGDHTFGNISHIEKIYSNPSNVANDLRARLEEFSRNSNSLWHDINRTKNLQKAVSELEKSAVEDIALAEYLLNSLLVLAGKVHRGPGLHMLHQELSGGMGLAVTKQDPVELLTTESWLRQLLQIIDILSDHLMTDDGLSKIKAYETVLNFYLTNTLKQRLKGPKVVNPSLLMRLARVFPRNSFVRKSFRNMYRQIKRRNTESHAQYFPYDQSIEHIREFLGKQ